MIEAELKLILKQVADHTIKNPGPHGIERFSSFKALNKLEFFSKGISYEWQVDDYLDNEASAINLNDQVLRRRATTLQKYQNGKWSSPRHELKITFKGPGLSTTIRQREEIEVDAESDCFLILSRLGYNKTMTVKKQRWAFQPFQDLTLCLDEVEGLGYFIEIEVVFDEKLKGVNAEEKVQETLSRLEFSDLRVEPQSYAKLLARSGRP